MTLCITGIQCSYGYTLPSATNHSGGHQCRILQTGQNYNHITNSSDDIIGNEELPLFSD